LRTPESKRLLNTATQELAQLLNNNKNVYIQTFLQGLTPTESTDCLGHYKELGQEAMSKKHMLLLNT
jgi:hypothetical protein